MKKIEAIIQPSTLDAVKDALTSRGVDGITVAQIRGYGRDEVQVELYRGNEFAQDLLPKLKLEMVVPDEQVDELVCALRCAAKNGKSGDGKIFVSAIEAAVRIRNGAWGEDAL
jgi:nitrogen regulatory protein P-II 1